MDGFVCLFVFGRKKFFFLLRPVPAFRIPSSASTHARFVPHHGGCTNCSDPSQCSLEQSPGGRERFGPIPTAVPEEPVFLDEGRGQPHGREGGPPAQRPRQVTVLSVVFSSTFFRVLFFAHYRQNEGPRCSDQFVPFMRLAHMCTSTKSKEQLARLWP